MPKPSGIKRVHTRECSRYGDGVTVGSERLEDTKAASRTIAEHVAIWNRHVDGCVCPSCSYVEAHLDDDDDQGEA
jgi:hypothetical protein